MKKLYLRIAAKYGMITIFIIAGVVAALPLIFCLLVIITIPTG
jgi:hypothetical protein